jgi:hypothetical protein
MESMKKSPGRYRCRWKDSFKVDVIGIMFGVVNLIHVAVKGLVTRFCKHGNESAGSRKCREFN